jgi:hypothetical protein
MTECTYCGCEVEAHDPVVVYESDPAAVGDGTASAGEFCNWGCLAAFVDESDVTAGTSCNWSPED